MVVPPLPGRPPARAHESRAHARGVSTPKGAGAAGRFLSHHPQTGQASSTHTREAQTPTQTPAANTPNPATHKQTRPQQAPLPPPRKHRQRPRHSAWAKKCERGNPWQQGDRHKTKRTRPTRARRQRTQGKRKQWGLRRVPPAPAKGGQRKRRAAHNSPRQSAWVVVFVGVFADVCRRFWAGWFGGLGVFWGCLACFLSF